MLLYLLCVEHDTEWQCSHIYLISTDVHLEYINRLLNAKSLFLVTMFCQKWCDDAEICPYLVFYVHPVWDFFKTYSLSCSLHFWPFTLFLAYYKLTRYKAFPPRSYGRNWIWCQSDHSPICHNPFTALEIGNNIQLKHDMKSANMKSTFAICSILFICQLFLIVHWICITFQLGTTYYVFLNLLPFFVRTWIVAWWKMILSVWHPIRWRLLIWLNLNVVSCTIMRANYKRTAYNYKRTA